MPSAAKYFDRGDPFDTLSGFAFAIDAKQWSFAYDCLTRESKGLITFTKFKFAMRFNVEVPELKVSIRSLILDAQRIRGLKRQGTTRAEIEVIYRLPNGNIFRPVIYFELEDPADAKAAGREDSLWLINLDKTIRDLGGADFSELMAR